MLHAFLPAPFSDAARHVQFEAVRAALAAEPQAPATLLLGNLMLPDGGRLDAVVIRPHSLTLLLLEPRGGHLAIRDFAHAAWQLDSAPLTGAAGADNPFQQFSQQKEALAHFLRQYLEAGQANLNFITGLLLFGEPVVFGREVEERMAAVPAASSFHLLADPTRFTRRLAQLATPEIDLTEADIAQLAQELTAGKVASVPETLLIPEPKPEPESELEPAAAAAGPAPAAGGGFLQQKATQLWHWLGAHDIDDLDTAPYGYEEVAARQQEKQELEQLRTTMQAEVATQLRALEAREAERERSLVQLREKLAAAPAVAPEAAALQARIAAESREKDILEAAMQASRAESEARNRELDAKIEQLSQLMLQMQAATAASAAAEPAAPAPPKPAANPAVAAGLGAEPTAAAAFSPVSAPAAARHSAAPAASAPAKATQPYARLLRKWRRRLPRLGIVAGGLMGLIVAIWAFRAATAGPPKAFEQNGRWGFLEADGDTLVPARYTSVAEFREGRAVVEKQGAFGFINDKGEETLAPAYDALNPCADGFARARIGDLYTFVDEKGEEFSHYYYNALDFSEGRAAVLDRRGWFYIVGPEAETKPPVLFQEAYSFHDGLARVKLQGTYTFISQDYLDEPNPDTKPFGRYTDAGDFADGRARVVQEGRTFYIDKSGEPTE
ncbi:WG containing repeat-containing protein [Hymenobacter daecheongensis DSM 21074]|uniref:WG containing repeat-containing protein n=1 Tax=Hymenobacter daecheongensis DSM 21074 TaxID=1121955 RepID=A0A1M6J6R3_9BACT|nr:WG repeat-containing protein [Hymenobacter daecheongensis]SHJ42345.1 WG containing repeat-containing protein [Hymenobacter daecheongensis DSM 21074]